MKIPKNHPRHASLSLRNAIVHGVEMGITSPHGLIAHGRGEALDYLLKEKTHPFAEDAAQQAAHVLLTAERPVLSVNGNAAALCPKELADLAQQLNCPLEVNIFHFSEDRIAKIAEHLESFGAENVLTPMAGSFLLGLSSDRRMVHPDGILSADVVLVPLEDGDRCEALRKAGKTVITIDLNPLSRTSKTADVTIVDNIIRALPNIQKHVKLGAKGISAYNNTALLAVAENTLRTGI